MEKFKRNPNSECAHCHAPLYRRPWQLAKGEVFCSVACSNYRKKVVIQCSVCGVVVPTRKRAKTCSRTCANKSRLGSKYNNGRPNDIVHKSVKTRQALVAERGGKCNRCPFTVIEILHVHHIVERCNGGTDEHSNLELLCPNCHTWHHYLLKQQIKASKKE